LPVHNEDLLPTLTMPVWLAMGDRDREWPIEECRALVTALPAAQLSVYDGDGHFPSAENPQRFNAELAALVLRAGLTRSSVK
jgi:pimeloyl-ACP methyl ester carboxylesterase